MADTVDTIVLHSSPTRYVVRLLNKSDGTGESAVVKVDKSTLVDVNGQEPAAVDIERCYGTVFGANHVQLLWDHTTDDEALILSGSFDYDFSGEGELRDPRSAGGTGDILLTSSGLVANGGYCIYLHCKLRNSRSS